MSLIHLLGDIFNLFLLQPVINLVIILMRALESMHIAGSLGLSIIILTVFVSLITWPFRSSQMRNMKKMNDKNIELKPKIDALKLKHKNDNLAFNQAKAALYKEHGVNPAAGCLPSLVPILLIYPLYQVILAFFDGAAGLAKLNYFIYSPALKLQSLPDTHFLGLNLASKPSDFSHLGIALLLVPLITAGLTFVQSRMMAPVPIKPNKDDSNKEVKEKVEAEDTAAAMQSQMTLMMPIMIGFFAYQFPVGLAIYWNTTTILSIIQQYRISGWGGLEDLIKRIRK